MNKYLDKEIDLFLSRLDKKQIKRSTYIFIIEQMAFNWEKAAVTFGIKEYTIVDLKEVYNSCYERMCYVIDEFLQNDSLSVVDLFHCAKSMDKGYLDNFILTELGFYPK